MKTFELNTTLVPEEIIPLSVSQKVLSRSIDFDPRAKLGDDENFLNNSHLIDPGLKSNSKVLQAVTDQVAKQINLGNHEDTIAARKVVLELVLSSLIKACHHNGCVAIRRSPNKYTALERYRHDWFAYRGIRHVTDQLLARGFAFWSKGKQKVRISRFWASSSLLELYENACQTVVQKPDFHSIGYKSLIILKDSEKNLIDFKENATTQELLRFTEQINKCNQIHFSNGIRINLNNTKEYQYIKRAIHITGCNIKTVRGIESNDEQGTITDSPTDNIKFISLLPDGFRLYRVFNDGSFKRGGRYYARFQNLQEKYRRQIVLCGHPVAELDYSCLHTVMLYHREGKPLPPNPYGYAKGTPERELVKMLLNAIYNSRDQNSSIWSILKKEIQKPKNSHLNKFLFQQNGKGYEYMKDLYKEFTKKHQDISEHFHSGIGSTLQNIDSKIATQVMLHFVKQKVPILPIHDSFIVPAPYKEELQRVMKEKYEDVMKKEFRVNGSLEIGVK